MIVDTVKCYFSAGTPSQWRLRLPQGSIGWSEPNIFDIEMRATSGGPDQCDGGTASASSEYDASHLAAYAFDDSGLPSAWAPSTGNATSWIAYTFPISVTVAEFAVRSNFATGPKQIVLEYWDGASWNSVYDTGTISSWGTNETKTFTV